MGGCMTQSDEEIRKAKKRNQQRSLQQGEVRVQFKAFNNRTCAAIAEPSNCNKSHKNLFKTFNDWDEDENPLDLEAIENKKVRKRRSSEDIRMVPKFGDISNG